MPDIQKVTSAIVPSTELNAGGTSTAEAQFKQTNAGNGVAAAGPLTVWMPGSGKLDKRPFIVRAWGRVKGGTTTNFTVKLYYGTSATIASNVNVWTSGAIATAGNGGQWLLEVEMSWDSVYGILSGIGKGFVIAVAVAQATLTTSAATTTLASSSSADGFTVTGQFSTGIASNLAYVDGLEVIPL